MESSGWIILGRNILEMDGYFGEKFSRAMAWIDLLLLAEWRSERAFYVRGNKVVIKRGQLAISVQNLSQRWGWSTKTVSQRLKEFEHSGRISVRRSRLVNVISIKNYDRYQNFPTESRVDMAENEPLPQQTTQQTTQQTSQLSITNRTINIESSNEDSSDSTESALSQRNAAIPFGVIAKMWNEHCSSFPKIIKISEARKAKIRIRIEEMGGWKTAKPILEVIFQKMQSSNFLRGENKRGWRATFDWVFENGKNWCKVYEGNYDKSQTLNNMTNEGTNADRNDYGERAKRARDEKFARHIASKLGSDFT